MYAEKFYRELEGFLRSVETSDGGGNALRFYDGIEMAARLIDEHTKRGAKLMFIGNGASQAISSHMAADFCKNGGIRSIAFTDPSLLTCISNDCGYAQLFQKSIALFADEGDVLIAISSSGRSENVLNGCSAAREKKCAVITLTGFQGDNPLRAMGDINFYVPAPNYGPVEIIHHSICQCIFEAVSRARGEPTG